MPPFLRELLQDLRYTLRQLRNAPVYALTAVLTLALGLGAATAMLAIVDSVLIRPVALPHAERLMHLGQIYGDRHQDVFLPKDIEALRADVRSFESVAAYGSLPAPITTREGTRVASRLAVLPGFFDVPQVPARLGRLPSAQDGNGPWAVINDSFWRENLHSNRNVLGSSITIEGRPLTIIGVLPSGYRFPEMMNGPLVFMPLLLNANARDVNNFNGSSEVVARLKPGVIPATALAEAKAVYDHLPRTKDDDRGRLTMSSYRDLIVGDVQPALLALLGACGLILLIACLNAANLQIARAIQRTGEISVRAALGATRRRLFQQLVTESVTISLLGAGFGLLFASVTLRGLRAAYSLRFPRFDELNVHPAAFAACALLAVLTGVLAALAPAWSAMRTATGPSPQAQRVTRRSRVSSTLVASEIALTCALLVTAGLFLRTFRALEQTPLGFDPHHVTELTLMPLNPQQQNPVLKDTYERLLTRLSTLPGVEAAATQTSLPFSSFNLSLTSAFKVTGRPENKQDAVDLSVVSSDYNRTLAVQPIQGRTFTSSDIQGSQPVCIVNEPFVRLYLQGRNALGTTFEFRADSTDGTDDRILKTPLTIVGIMPDQVTGQNLENRSSPTIFIPFSQFPADAHMAHFVLGLAPQFAVRSSLPQATLEREIRAALKEAAPDMAEMQIGSMEGNIAASLTRQKLALRLAGGFGLLALVLAGVGIYGVLASSVAQRTREIGIRMALGSSRERAMLLVLKQAAAMVLLGLAAGLLCAWPAGRAVKAFLFGVTPLDPLTLGLAAAVLLLVCAVAAAVPAWRATQVDPVVALRAE